MLRRSLIRLAMTVAAVAVVLMVAAYSPTPANAAEPIAPGTEVDRIATREKVVALTFDDAWIDADLESILDTLKEEGIKATFFPTGAGVESSPELARRIVAEGHELGSHSYRHWKLEEMTTDEVIAQVQMAEEAFSAAGLEDPVPLFRAPWGEVNAKVLAVLQDEGYIHVTWTARGGDNVVHRSPAQVIVYIMASVRPGAIIVMHTNNDVAPEALPELIRRLRAKGYGFVTLSEALLTSEQRMARYQQTSPLLSYLGEWDKEESTLESGGSISSCESAGDSVLASFTGTTLELLARTGPDCGKIQVTIDGEKAGEVDLYNPAEQHRVTVFSASDLADSSHLALISCVGDGTPAATGHSINIDAVRVAGELIQAPAPRVYALGRLLALVLAPYRDLLGI